MSELTDEKKVSEPIEIEVNKEDEKDFEEMSLQESIDKLKETMQGTIDIIKAARDAHTVLAEKASKLNPEDFEHLEKLGLNDLLPPNDTIIRRDYKAEVLSLRKGILDDVSKTDANDKVKDKLKNILEEVMNESFLDSIEGLMNTNIKPPTTSVVAANVIDQKDNMEKITEENKEDKK